MNCRFCGGTEMKVHEEVMVVCVCCGFVQREITLEQPAQRVVDALIKTGPVVSQGYEKFSMRKRAQVVEYKIAIQFSETQEDKLALSIIVSALDDFVADEPFRRNNRKESEEAFLSRHGGWVTRHNSALEFLTGEMQALDYCVIEPSWVHRLLKECGVLNGSETKIEKGV